jgi:deoxycytidylate deaminase
MRRVTGNELERIRPYFDLAAEAASHSKCIRADCGSVIIDGDGQVIGTGYNGPPLGDESQRTCVTTWDYEKKPKFDITCCIHAEWRAVLDACKRNPDKLTGSTLYFMRVDADGRFTDSPVPYCTVCSRLTMEAGVAEFAMWNDQGADIYPLPEFNRASYAFFEPTYGPAPATTD